MQLQLDCVCLLGGAVGIYDPNDVFHVARIIQADGPRALRTIERKGIGVGLRAGLVANRMMETTDAARVRLLNIDAPPGPYWLLNEHIRDLGREETDLELRKIGVLDPLPKDGRRKATPELPTMEDILDRPWSWAEVFGERPTRKGNRKAVIR